MPWPSSTRPVLIVAVLSLWIVTHESIEFGSYGALLANGLSAACALPASAPSELKPTISAPPPFRNVRRESSLLEDLRHDLPPFAITAAAFWIAVRIRG